MAKIELKDLTENREISKEEMKKANGGLLLPKATTYEKAVNEFTEQLNINSQSGGGGGCGCGGGIF